VSLMEAIATKTTSEGEQRKKEIINKTGAEVQKIEGEGKQEANILKGKADALSAGLFQDQLKLSPAPDQDWHWSIVQAKGVRITGTSPVSPTVPNSAPGNPIVPSSSPSLAPIAAPATVSTTGKSLN